MTGSSPTGDSAPLTPEEVEFLNRYTGTRPNPEALERFRELNRQALETVQMPDLPHIQAICDALPAVPEKYRAIDATAFVDNAQIDVPDSDQVMTVRAWLESGGDLEVVIRLAESLHWII